MKKVLISILSLIILIGNIFPGFVVLAKDVKEYPSSWALEEVQAMNDKGILDDYFYSDYRSDISREDFAYMMLSIFKNYEGLDLEMDRMEAFEDTDAESLLLARRMGLISGYEDNSFRPNNPISRQEMAHLMSNLIELIKNVDIEFPEVKQDFNFRDKDEIYSYAFESVRRLTNYGILKGKSENYFKPFDNSTREEAILISYRLNSFIVDNSDYLEIKKDLDLSDYDLVFPEEKPVIPEEKPVIPEEKPVNPEEKPVNPEEKPVNPEEKPVNPEEKPVNPEEKPVNPEEKPVNPEEKPVNPEEKPVDPEEKPVNPEEKPVDPEEKPVIPEEKPVDPEEKPVIPEEKPVNPEEKPVNPEEKPVDPEEKPVDPEEKPVIPEEKPVDLEEKPTDLEERPVEEVSPIAVSISFLSIQEDARVLYEESLKVEDRKEDQFYHIADLMDESYSSIENFGKADSSYILVTNPYISLDEDLDEIKFYYFKQRDGLGAIDKIIRNYTIRYLARTKSGDMIEIDDREVGELLLGSMISMDRDSSYHKKFDGRDFYLVDPLQNMTLFINDRLVDGQGDIFTLDLIYEEGVEKVIYDVNYLDQDDNQILTSKKHFGALNEEVEHQAAELEGYELVGDRVFNERLSKDLERIDFYYRPLEDDIDEEASELENTDNKDELIPDDKDDIEEDLELEEEVIEEDNEENNLDQDIQESPDKKEDQEGPVDGLT